MHDGSLKETLEYLSALQDVDKQLFYLESSKGDLPKTVDRLKEEFKQKEEDKIKIEDDIKNIDQERRNTEGLVSLAKEKLKKYQNQLYDVTSNKEYDAITQEIELKKKEIDEGELHILELDQESENLDVLLKEGSNEKEQILKELEVKESELLSVLKTTEQRELKLKHQREKIVVRLKDSMLKRYERIRIAKNGIAVVPVTRDACGGCYKTIPPQKIVEIEKLTEIIQCEVCGRILVPDNKLNKVAV
ncbi:zinc ribbon domain-containing protein [candidate division KSB1 bacterium]